MTPTDTKIDALLKDGEPGRSPDATSDPVFLLSPPLSLSSLLCAMLGQHPQMYGLPETHLFGFETLAEWWEGCSLASFNMAHGLLRVVAEIYFGEQTETSVQLASAWLRRRLPFTTGYLLELIAEKVRPRLIVEKSPSIVFHIGSMQRAHRMFPQARFIQLVQHPRAYGESVMEAIREAATHGPVPDWLIHLASFSDRSASEHVAAHLAADLDPQWSWHALHSNICQFLEEVPDDHKMWIRGEDVLSEPEPHLLRIADWMGLRTDAEAIEAMKHPERSPYACFGPPSAHYGNDPGFLQSPELRPAPTKPQRLEGPLNWREDKQEFSLEAKRLASQFGYD